MVCRLCVGGWHGGKEIRCGAHQAFSGEIIAVNIKASCTYRKGSLAPPSTINHQPSPAEFDNNKVATYHVKLTGRQSYILINQQLVIDYKSISEFYLRTMVGSICNRFHFSRRLQQTVSHFWLTSHNTSLSFLL